MAVDSKKILQRLKLPEVTKREREELGRGSYATVFEVMVHGTPCAAKEVHPILMSENCKNNFYAECIQSSQLLHPNIVQFMGIYYPSPSAELPWLVTELMYISLTGLIEQRVKEEKDIPFHFKVSMQVDICQGLQFLHSKSIAHRDLSSNNILLTKHLVAKIADLGMAKVMSGDAGQKHTMAPGTQVFMPPEALEGTDEAIYGITIDVFSLGCICLHVISMQWPKPKPVKQLDDTTGRIVALTELQRREKYLTAVFQHFPPLKALVCECLHDFPKKRPAVGAVLEGLRAVYIDVVPRENNNIIQLCDYYKSLLQQKDQELAQKSDQLEFKEKELNDKDNQLNIVTLKFERALEVKAAKLLEAEKQVALKLAETKKQDQQLIESQQQLEKLLSQIGSNSGGSISGNSKLPQSRQQCIETTMPKQQQSVHHATNTRSFHSYQQPFPIRQQQYASAVSGEGDKPQDSKDKTELVNEEDNDDKNGGRTKYKRAYHISLDQSKHHPLNLMNAENIKKESSRPSLMLDRNKKMDLSLKEQMELKKADKRWVRPVVQEVDLAKAEKETQELFRKFIGILNKLTPQKFATLANQALEMPIDTEDRLKGCIDRILNKVVEEPNSSVACAQLCRVLSKVSVEVGTGPDVKKKTFRSLLLTKCQQEFERDKESDTVIAELKKKLEEAIPEEKRQLEEELSEKEYQLQHRYLGTIKFIGELFKLKMLSEGIMHECIRRLLQSTSDEEALECFAKLMFTIGKDLDHEKGQGLIKQYMDRVELIINAGKISSRIKVSLQDVLELRNANWVPRRENNNPKKIDQIHQEAKQEEAEKMRRELTALLGISMDDQQVSKASLDMDSRKKSMKDGSSKMGSDWSSGSDKDKKTLSSQPKLESTKFRNIGKQPGTQLTFAPSKLRPGGSAFTADNYRISRLDSKSKPSRYSVSGSKRSDSQSGSISVGGGGPMIGSGQSRRSYAVPDKQRERQQALELVSNVSRISCFSSGSSKGESIAAHGIDIERLMELLRSHDLTNIVIMNCIEKEYPESRERNLIFIRDLGMALFRTVIDGSGSNAKYNEELFDSRITIVTKYIEPQNDSNHLRQLEFLYALQMVLHELEQPAGLATIICKKLSEGGVFEDAAFHLWKTSGSESIGHGTTMLALKDFFDWLERMPVESDYS